jgi:membrane-associated phospholipid phosphatase
LNINRKIALTPLTAVIFASAVLQLIPKSYAGTLGITSAFLETKDITTSAFSPSETGLTELAFLTAFTPLVAAGDDQLSGLICPSDGESRSASLDTYSDAAGVYVIPLAAGLWATGYLADSEEIATVGRDVLVAQGLSLAACAVLKTTFGRARPTTGEGSARFRPFAFDDKYSSFPSNHTTVAFATAATVSTRYPNPYLAVTLYVAATGVAYARVYNRDHWPSDVFASAVIGTAIGRAAGAYGRPDDESTESRDRLWVNPTEGLLGVSYRM